MRGVAGGEGLVVLGGGDGEGEPGAEGGAVGGGWVADLGDGGALGTGAVVSP